MLSQPGIYVQHGFLSVVGTWDTIPGLVLCTAGGLGRGTKSSHKTKRKP